MKRMGSRKLWQKWKEKCKERMGKEIKRWWEETERRENYEEKEIEGKNRKKKEKNWKT